MISMIVLVSSQLVERAKDLWSAQMFLRSYRSIPFPDDSERRLAVVNWSNRSYYRWIYDWVRKQHRTREKIRVPRREICFDDTQSSRIRELVTTDGRSCVWCSVGNCEATETSKKVSSRSRCSQAFPTGDSVRFSLRNTRNLVMKRVFDDVGFRRTSEGVNRSLRISTWRFSSNLRSSFNFRQAGK